MIRYVTGTLGAGKTFHSTRLLIEHLTKGGVCVTNIECNFEKIQRVIASRSKVWIEPDQLRVFDPELTPDWQTVIPWGEAEGQVLVVLDEAHLFYNARDWATTASANKHLLSFLTQSRKAGVDVLWITQDSGNVDKQFRVLAEWELAIVNTKHLPLGWLGMLPFNAYCVKHVSSRGNFLVKKEWYLYDKWLFGTYRTSSMLNASMREMSAAIERCGFRSLRRVTFKETSSIKFADFLTYLKSFIPKFSKP